MSISSNVQQIYKYLYPDGVPLDVMSFRHEVFKRVKKTDDFEGFKFHLPIDAQYPTGRSHTFSLAQSSAGNSKPVAMDITRATDYFDLTFKAEDMRASRSKRGAFEQIVQHDTDLALKALGNSIARDFYGNSGGALGRLAASSSISGATITLEQSWDVRNFDVGATVAFSSADGTSGAVRSGTLTVLSRSLAAGTVTFTANVTVGISAATDHDYVFMQGDFGLGASGLAAWFPLTAPTAGDNFFGCDRSPDPEGLAGFRLTNTAADMAENMLTLGEYISFRGGSPDIVSINPVNYSTLIRQLGSKVLYTQNGKGDAAIGFEGVKCYLSSGAAEIVADPDCPATLLYELTLASLEIHHLDPLPHRVEDDGNTMLRQGTVDGVEIRWRSWWNLMCESPVQNGVAQLA